MLHFQIGRNHWNTDDALPIFVPMSTSTLTRVVMIRQCAIEIQMGLIEKIVCYHSATEILNTSHIKPGAGIAESGLVVGLVVVGVTVRQARVMSSSR